jgi:hypothetical protein
VQGRQWIKLALDGPIRPNDGVFAIKQPDAHDTLQQVCSLRTIWHVKTFLDQLLA